MNVEKSVCFLAIAAGTLVAAITLSVLFDSGFLGNDFAQTISVANNLIRGNGLRTELIYYDVHYALGGFPVLQTVFPPGQSALVAALMYLGIPVYPAAFLLSLASHLATAGILAIVVRRLGGSAFTAVVAYVVWLCVGVNWASVLLCRSEVLFTLLTVMGLYCFVRWSERDSNAGLYLALLGLSAAAAFLMRYQGLFVIAGFGLYFAIRFVAKRDKPSLIDGIIVASAPCLAVAVVIAYNTAVTGGWGGGPVDHAAHSSNLARVAVGFYYEFSRILGVSREGLLSFGAGETLGVLLAAYCGYVSFRYRILSRTWQATRAVPALGFCLVYLSVSLAALFYLSLVKSTGYIQARYLSTLLPFAIVFALVVGAHIRQSGELPQRLFRFGVALTLGFIVLGQARAISEQIDFVTSDTRLRDIRMALSLEVDGNTVQEYLQAEIDSGAHLLANQSQLVGHVLDRPTFGLTPSLYSDRVFDFDEVSALTDIYEFRYILLFPALYDPDALQNGNRVILTELLNDNGPEWITRDLEDENIHLYRINKAPESR